MKNSFTCWKILTILLYLLVKASVLWFTSVTELLSTEIGLKKTRATCLTNQTQNLNQSRLCQVIFPRFAPATCICLVFLLVLCVVYVCCDWLITSVWILLHSWARLWKPLLLKGLYLPALSSLKPNISFVIYNFLFVIRLLPAGQATVEMGWGYLRKQLREFTLNTQVQRFD